MHMRMPFILTLLTAAVARAGAPMPPDVPSSVLAMWPDGLSDYYERPTTQEAVVDCLTKHRQIIERALDREYQFCREVGLLTADVGSTELWERTLISKAIRAGGHSRGRAAVYLPEEVKFRPEQRKDLLEEARSKGCDEIGTVKTRSMPSLWKRSAEYWKRLIPIGDPSVALRAWREEGHEWNMNGYKRTSRNLRKKYGKMARVEGAGTLYNLASNQATYVDRYADLCLAPVKGTARGDLDFVSHRAIATQVKKGKDGASGTDEICLVGFPGQFDDVKLSAKSYKYEGYLLKCSDDITRSTRYAAVLLASPALDAIIKETKSCFLEYQAIYHWRVGQMDSVPLQWGECDHEGSDLILLRPLNIALVYMAA